MEDQYNIISRNKSGEEKKGNDYFMITNMNRMLSNNKLFILKKEIEMEVLNNQNKELQDKFDFFRKKSVQQSKVASSINLIQGLKIIFEELNDVIEVKNREINKLRYYIGKKDVVIESGQDMKKGVLKLRDKMENQKKSIKKLNLRIKDEKNRSKQL